MPEETDLLDPCAAYERLLASWHALLRGERVAQTEFEVGSGTRKRVEFAKVNAALIRQELSRLEAACRKARGLGCRQVIRGG